MYGLFDKQVGGFLQNGRPAPFSSELNKTKKEGGAAPKQSLTFLPYQRIQHLPLYEHNCYV